MTFEYNIAYPVRCARNGYRWVSEDFIRMRYSDAVANGEVDHTDLTNIDEIMDELESAGHVAFNLSKPKRPKLAWPATWRTKYDSY